ncbi:hypothetical protein [Hyphococcus luteus]|uniref:hypothetical protein n=1 Tax=Hyphococcus luteus TaxID=2058213 RepID=UPI0013FDA772|nr:hypothetical protein [Marinicaulis flavus]
MKTLLSVAACLVAAVLAAAAASALTRLDRLGLEEPSALIEGGKLDPRLPLFFRAPGL